MPDQKIVEYIKGQLSLGLDRNKIRTDLMMAGSLPSEIDLAFSSLSTNPQSVPPVAQNIPVPPVSATPVTPSQPVKKKSSALSVILIILVLILVILGGYFGFNY